MGAKPKKPAAKKAPVKPVSKKEDKKEEKQKEHTSNLPHASNDYYADDATKKLAKKQSLADQLMESTHGKKHHKHHHHSKAFVGLRDFDSDDMFHEEEAEDKGILESLAYAEQRLGKEMGTPQRVPTERGRPVKYDVEAVQLKAKDYNDADDVLNPDGEDKQIL